MKKSTWALASIVLSTGLILSACGGQKGSSSNTASSQKAITITTFGELTTLDSADYDDVPTSDMLGQAFEGLYRIGSNDQIELGMAATKPEISADGMTYTFTLRDGVKWSNGEAVTADDFVYTYQKLVDPKEAVSAQSAYVFKNGEKIAKGELAVDELGVKALDSKTLQITLEYPAPYLPKLLTGTRFLPQNKKIAQEKGDAYGSNSDSIVSNGPFKIEGWTGSESSWKLVKNTNYWDEENVALESVTVNVAKEVSTATQLFDAKEVQYTTVSDEYVSQYSQTPTFHTQPKALTGYMSFNVARPTTGNVHFRRALSMAFDKEALVKNVLKDGSTSLDGLVPLEFGLKEDGTDFREASGSLLSFNVAEAQKEWAEAKKELGQDQITVTLLTSDTGISKKVGEYLQAQLQTNLSGLTFKLQPVPLKNRLELQRADDFDIFYGTWTPDYQDPLNFLEQYATGGGINFANYSNASYDESVAKVKTQLATSEEDRWAEMMKAEKILMDDAIVAPIYQGAQSYLLDEKVKGLEVLPFGRTINLRTVTLN